MSRPVPSGVGDLNDSIVAVGPERPADRTEGDGDEAGKGGAGMD